MFISSGLAVSVVEKWKLFKHVAPLKSVIQAQRTSVVRHAAISSWPFYFTEVSFSERERKVRRSKGKIAEYVSLVKASSKVEREKELFTERICRDELKPEVTVANHVDPATSESSRLHPCAL